MKINNNYNKFNTQFSQAGKDSPIMLTYEQKMNILVPKTKEVLAETAEKQVPENGLFRKVFVSFSVPDTDNKALLGIEYDEAEPKTQRRLFVGVHHNNSDRLTQNYLLKGTKAEILEYLKDNSNQQSIIDSVNNLSKKTDEYYSSL
ncbi:hypothetical protein IJD15_01445 [bacterium]|nr:hypothetical protein [bacterium]